MPEKEIRTIMAALTDGHVLLPNSAVAEVLEFTSPNPIKKTPAWLLGELDWQGWQVPVICYEYLISDTKSNALTSKARILIIKTLGESTQVNYIGLIIQGLPKLTKVTADTLVEQQGGDLPETVFSMEKIEELTAMIPEIGKLTAIVDKAAYGD